jgi:hypothetical protein
MTGEPRPRLDPGRRGNELLCLVDQVLTYVEYQGGIFLEL